MNWKELEPKVLSLQQGLKDIMEEVRQMASKESELPKPGKGYENAQKLLANEQYEVVVCGEVKKGKSSFINALLGHRLLPVDSDITTAQVFRISNSDNESFELVFTDGSKKYISKEDLDKYGSQISYNLTGDPDLEGKVIDYINVNTHAAFLPKGVNLVDTPGLGTIYGSYEALTRGYVRKAAAVIFILDFEAPIGEQEKRFINEVLDVTPYVIYVATRSDLYNGENRKKLLDRNNEILREIYAARNLQAPQIRPFSSEMLMSASELVFGAEEAELESGYKKVIEEFRHIVYESVVLFRTGNAVSAMSEFVDRVSSVIAGIITDSRNENDKARQEIETNIRKIQEEFQQDWSVDSPKLRELEREINDICSNINNDVQALFFNDNGVWSNAQKLINNLESISEAENLAKNIQLSIAEEILMSWKKISYDACCKIESKLNEIAVSMGDFYLKYINGDYNKATDNKVKSPVESAFFSNITCLADPIGVIVDPIGPILLNGAALNYKKQNLSSGLNHTREQMSVSVSEMTRDYIKSLLSKAKIGIESEIKRREQQMQNELNNLIEYGKMNEEEKDDEIQRWIVIQTEWMSVVNTTHSLMDSYNQFVRDLNY